MIFITNSVSLHSELSALIGVNAVSWHEYDRDLSVRILADDALFNDLDQHLRLFKYDKSAAGNISATNATILLKASNGTNVLSRYGNYYTIALPIWQFGIVSFPAWYRLMENALFFNDGVPHLAPGPYVAFRIDDVPVTGESYLKQGYSEFRACSEIREIQSAHRFYGARMEYMLTSNVISKDGVLKAANKVAPKAFQKLADLYRGGDINIGVHGQVHLDVVAYRHDGTIKPREFLTLDETQTLSTLQSLKQWAREKFAKDTIGFVAPAWGYREGVTKPVARRMFRYIADSNQHLQESDGKELFGSVQDGCVNMFETWRCGMSGVRMARQSVFNAFLGAGLPVHLMLHGPLVRDPLTPLHKKLAVLFAVFLLAAGNIWLAYSGGTRIVMAVLAVQLIFAMIAYSKRQDIGWWSRLTFIRFLGGESLRHLAHVARQTSAEWMFVEEMAEHMEGFAAITLVSVTSERSKVTVKIVCNLPLARPLSVHFPFTLERATLNPDGAKLIVDNHIVRMGPLAAGDYEVTVHREGLEY